MGTIGRTVGHHVGWDVGRNPRKGEVTTNPPASHGAAWEDSDAWVDNDTWEE